MQDIIQGPITTVAQYGLLGALLILSVAYIWVLTNRLNKEKDNRLNDWKEVAEVLKEHDQVVATFSASSDARTRALEASARSQELATAAQGSTLDGFKQVAAAVAEHSRELQRLREALMRSGVSL